jgi:hypothetical protein
MKGLIHRAAVLRVEIAIILEMVVKTRGTTMCQNRSCVWTERSVCAAANRLDKLTRSEWMLLMSMITTHSRYL